MLVLEHRQRARHGVKSVPVPVVRTSAFFLDHIGPACRLQFFAFLNMQTESLEYLCTVEPMVSEQSAAFRLTRVSACGVMYEAF